MREEVTFQDIEFLLGISQLGIPQLLMSSEEETISADLSSRGLKNITVEKDDFRFVFEGSEELRCSRFKAQFLSPRVARLLQSDNTIDQFHVKVSC
jgi:hypothetical protein